MTRTKDIFAVFRRYEREAGIVGVAMGNKVPGDRKSPRALTFVVPRKLPRRGAKRTLSTGRMLLPKTVTIGDVRMRSDVVAAWASGVGSGGAAADVAAPPTPRFSEGSQISNLTETGTLGCLVRRSADPRLFALTNRHVAIGTGNNLFVPEPVDGAIFTEVQADLDLIDDRIVLPFLTDPDGYVDVDAAIAAIPEPATGLFSPDLPLLGRPTSIFQPDYSSAEAYHDSVVGKSISSYSWNTGRRDGVITATLFATRAPRGGALVLYTYLIAGVDGVIPSESRDSGKVWVASTTGGAVELVALHLGTTVPSGEFDQHAVATDFCALARLLAIAPA